MMQKSHSSRLAWVAAGLAGVLLPALAMAWLSGAPMDLERYSGPVVAAGLMGMGVIGAAAAGRFWAGVGLAMAVGVALVALARLLGLPALPHPFSTGLAVVLAATSFAARGALFSRAYPARGWWLGVLVVAGEAATLVTAAALPAWLLALLPAQWASTALQTAIAGTGTRAASSALFALGGTAAATLLVAWLWPRRWPYLIMFSVWLALSALVLQRPAPLVGSAGQTQLK